METSDLKKEKVKRILASIEHSAYALIDSGDNHHPMDLIMDLTMTAYELDIMTNFVDRFKGEEPTDKSNKKVIKLKPKGKA